MRTRRPSLSRWLWSSRPLWQRALVVAASPLCALNLSVCLLGGTLVFPLSPFFLAEKAAAVGRYAGHRVRCVLTGHPGLDELTARAGRRHGLPPGLLEALVEVESKGEPHRISAAGAMGPAQLTAATAAHLGVADPFEPAAALDGGARYLAAQLQRFGEVRLALAAYNAGPGAVHGQVPRNGETEFYVEKVMAEYARRAPVTQERRPEIVSGRRGPALAAAGEARTRTCSPGPR